MQGDPFNQELYVKYGKYAWVGYVASFILGLLFFPWWSILPFIVFIFLVTDLEVPSEYRGKVPQILAGYLMLFSIPLIIGSLLWWGGVLLQPK